MVTFRNNNRRSNFRRNDRGFKNNNSDKTKFTNNLNGNENFSRKNGSRNNVNAPKLFEKYSNLFTQIVSLRSLSCFLQLNFSKLAEK